MGSIGKKLSVILAFTLLMLLSGLAGLVSSANIYSAHSKIIAEIALDGSIMLAAALLCARLISGEAILRRRLLIPCCYLAAALLFVVERVLGAGVRVVLHDKLSFAATAFVVNLAVAAALFLLRFSVFSYGFRLFYRGAERDGSFTWLCIVAAAVFILFKGIADTADAFLAEGVFGNAVQNGSLTAFLRLFGVTRYAGALDGMFFCAPLMAFAVMVRESDSGK